MSLVARGRGGCSIRQCGISPRLFRQRMAALHAAVESLCLSRLAGNGAFGFAGSLRERSYLTHDGSTVLAQKDAF